MNKRLNELADQAWEATAVSKDFGHPVSFAEKLSELIIAECMMLCQTAVGNADYNTGRMHCLNNIKEHFGVK